MDLEEYQVEKRQFIEDAGMLFEELFNLPRMAGRILGYLLLHSLRYCSTREIQKTLGCSKGYICSVTKLLITSGLIKRKRISGRPDIFYSLKPGFHIELLRKHLNFLKVMHEISNRGLSLVAIRDSQQRERLREIHDLSAFVEHEINIYFTRTYG